MVLHWDMKPSFLAYNSAAVIPWCCIETWNQAFWLIRVLPSSHGFVLRHATKLSGLPWCCRHHKMLHELRNHIFLIIACLSTQLLKGRTTKLSGLCWHSYVIRLEVCNSRVQMIFLARYSYLTLRALKVHKIENFFVSDFGICVISLLVMYK